jgi:hypothetical protein
MLVTGVDLQVRRVEFAQADAVGQGGNPRHRPDEHQP